LFWSTTSVLPLQLTVNNTRHWRPTLSLLLRNVERDDNGHNINNGYLIPFVPESLLLPYHTATPIFLVYYQSDNMMQPNNGAGGGPQWANPQGTPQQQTTVSLGQQEQEFFAPLSTLDEPVKETIMRDVRSVASKLKVVMLPMDRTVCHI
jgi:hypothetical protein